MIDSHCHLADRRVFKNLETIQQELKTCVERGLRAISLGGTDPEEWDRQLKIQNEVRQNFPSLRVRLNFGVHPWWVEKCCDPQDLDSLLQQLETQMDQAHGLGETGLDFGQKRDIQKFELQKIAFHQQIKLALHKNKPLVLHIVKAHEEALKILKEQDAVDHPIQVHRFSGSLEQLKVWLKFPNVMISLCGSEQYVSQAQKSSRLKELVQNIPLERLLLETDAPDGFLHPYDIIEFYFKIAQIKEVSLESLQTAIYKNFELLYSPTKSLWKK